MPEHPSRGISSVGQPPDHPHTPDDTGHSTGPDAPAAPAAPPPTHAGRYELLAEIARGGMGVVYRARDTSLNRNVAVKLLQDKYPPGSLAGRRFLDEARITAQLQHPGIPPLR